MNRDYDLSLKFMTTSGSTYNWVLRDVRTDIASYFAAAAQGIIDSGAFDAGRKGDLTALVGATLIERYSSKIEM